MEAASNDTASLVTRGLRQYSLIMEDRADPRVKDWLLMSSPAPTLVICLAYLLVVRVLGPMFMRNREPYSLKYPMLAYNLFQVLFNGWIFLGEQRMQSSLKPLDTVGQFTVNNKPDI